MPPPRLADAAAELIARFRRQRPLRGGSLIVTLFGDSIMPRGGAISLGSLIALAAPFGLNERLVRTATARLANEGWLVGRREGKRSEYRLSDDGRERFTEATNRIYGAAQTGWSGRWTVVVVPRMRAAERQELKEELIWRGFGEISTHVFAHPEIDARSLGLPQPAPRGALEKLIVFDADLAGGAMPERLLHLGWDLAELGLRYARFVTRFERVLGALQAGRSPDPHAAFIVRTLLIHEYRRLHLRDPLLPPRLLPADWPGATAAALCGKTYARVFKASETHLAQVAMLLDGPLPAPHAAVLERFGGIITA
jgi:phenylacetic acid degradation operon negative regulatory protein